eukprot:m.161026 g.161026  ORF g.161026 m.161026 type:complete len:68 (-) comp23818_c0_seq3:605-808(-)
MLVVESPTAWRARLFATDMWQHFNSAMVNSPIQCMFSFAATLYLTSEAYYGSDHCVGDTAASRRSGG